MAAPRIKLISTLIRKKLYEQVDSILSISRQGFDVHIKSDFPEVEKILIELLEKELSINTREFRLVTKITDLSLDHSNVDNIEKEPIFAPTLLVTSKTLENGYGFANFAIPSPDNLIGSVASSIQVILNHFGLDVYLDVFDADTLSKLKQIARIFGINTLVDAVVQTAYLGGFQGDSKKAKNYLEHLQTENASNIGRNNFPLEKCAEMFLSHVISKGEDAHCFLKSSLSYFMVNQRGLTMSRASQVLSMSRTTLQEHLKLAEQLGVSQFFEGMQSHF